MPPEVLFGYPAPVAMLGWVALSLSPLAPRAAQIVAGLLIPTLLAVTYTALILVHWTRAPGGFDSLTNVMALFTDPNIALAGWLHYLAFDLLSAPGSPAQRGRRELPIC